MTLWERHRTGRNDINTVFLQVLAKCFVQLRKTSSHFAGYGGLIGKDSKRKGDLSFDLKDREDCVSRGVGEGTQSGLRDQQVQRHEVRRVWCLRESGIGIKLYRLEKAWILPWGLFWE